MKYSGQHNGRGKVHLIGMDDIVCGSKGTFLCTQTQEVFFEDNNFYEIDGFTKSITIAQEEFYCTKCLNKIRNEKRN